MGAACSSGQVGWGCWGRRGALAVSVRGWRRRLANQVVVAGRRRRWGQVQGWGMGDVREAQGQRRFGGQAHRHGCKSLGGAEKSFGVSLMSLREKHAAPAFRWLGLSPSRFSRRKRALYNGCTLPSAVAASRGHRSTCALGRLHAACMWVADTSYSHQPTTHEFSLRTATPRCTRSGG